MLSNLITIPKLFHVVLMYASNLTILLPNMANLYLTITVCKEELKVGGWLNFQLFAKIGGSTLPDFS